MDLSSIKGVRFSISKDLWHERDFYNTLPDRVYGTFDQWLTIASRTPKITWDDGQTDTRLTLEQILPPEYSMKLEEYADGRRPPRPKGQPRQHPQPASDADAITIDIEYKRGARNLTQTWVYAEPDSIDVDERTQERFRPKINREADQYSSPYRFVQNVALPMKLIKKMFGESGWINQRLSGEDNTYQNRKTTVGEGIQYISYMIAIANNPGQPVREMWAEKTKPGVKTVLPPPGIGRFGMAENRFLRLTQLVPLCYSVSEAELDQSDPWRYVNPFIDGFNDHWKEIYAPSWLLAPDELMSQWTGQEGVDIPKAIPFSSYVPRKPAPRGAELKCVCDGESGVMMRVELALKYKRKRGVPPVQPPYTDEYTSTAAVCLRLAEPWLNTNRCFAADAHFIGMDSVEALRENGIFGFGDLKTISSRFPVEQLESHCGTDSGDWNVMKSTFGSGDWLCYGVAHRRGGAIHTYLSTCGTTKRGKDQKHKDDTGEDGSTAPPRKCPKILNDFTQAQPHVDKHNRWRQHILAIEERFRTESFAFRLFTTLIVGCAAVSTYTGFTYHKSSNEQHEPDVHDQKFRAMMEEIAVDGMTNTWDADHDEAGAAPSTAGRPRAGAPNSGRATPTMGGGSSSEVPPEMHVPISIAAHKRLTGFSGATQQRCGVCRVNLVSHCCSACSTPTSIVAICRPDVQYGRRITTHPCLAMHRDNPAASHRCTASASKQAAGAKRKRDNLPGRGGGGRGRG